jgi:DHA1 family chloramphenicol resistance protein-like MFS transporter
VLFSAIPVVLFVLVLLNGALSFAVGSTLIATSMRAAGDAPTLSGSFATASLNVGAAAGPILGGLAYGTTAVATGPLVVSVLLVCAAALVALVFRRSFLEAG